MHKKGYFKFKYYLTAFPEFKFGGRTQTAYCALVKKRMGGSKFLIFKTKKSLNQEIEITKLREGSNYVSEESFKVKYKLNIDFDEEEKAICDEYFFNWETLYDQIVSDQRANKIEYHWEYRNYNYLWRLIISQAKQHLNLYETTLSELLRPDYHTTAVEEGLSILERILSICKLLKNTILHIETTIKDNGNYQIPLTYLKQDTDSKLKISILETINDIFNYRHPTVRKNVYWERGIRIEYNEKNDKYNVNTNVLYKGPFVNMYGGKKSTPREVFESQYFSAKDDVVKIEYEKIGWASVPMKIKYKYPFGLYHGTETLIYELIYKLKDEIGFNMAYSAKENSPYLKRVGQIITSLNDTKNYLEEILKPFKPFDFDRKFLNMLEDKIGKNKIWMNGNSYYVHDHEHIRCIEQHHMFLSKMLDALQKFYETKNENSIKVSYSQLDQKMKDYDSFIIFKLLEDFGITQNKKAVNNKDIGALRGIVEALQHLGFLPNQLHDNINLITLQIRMKYRKTRESKASRLYKSKATEYLNSYKKWLDEKDTPLIEHESFSLELQEIKDEIVSVKVLLQEFTDENRHQIEKIIAEIESIDDAVFEQSWNNKIILDQLNSIVEQTKVLDAQEKEQLKNQINDTGLTVKHKIKFTLPLIFLKYEGEVELGNKQKLPKTFKEVKELLIQEVETEDSK